MWKMCAFGTESAKYRRSHCIPTCASAHPVGSYANGPLGSQSGAAPSVPLRAGARGAYCPHAKGTVRQASVFALCCDPHLRPRAAPSPPRHRDAHLLCRLPAVARIPRCPIRCPIRCLNVSRSRARSSGASVGSLLSYYTSLSF